MAFTWLLELSPNIPLVIDAPALITNRRIYAYYVQLKKIRADYIKELGVDISTYNRAQIVENALSPHIEPYYKAIAALLTPTFEVSKLTMKSCFDFFAQTDTPSRLSGLEQLLNLTFKEEVQDETNQVFETVRITSGDAEIDLMSDLLLVFKGQAIPLAKSYGAEYLNKLVVHSSRRLNESEVKNQEQTDIDKKAFEKNASVIDKQFKANGAAGVVF